ADGKDDVGTVGSQPEVDRAVGRAGHQRVAEQGGEDLPHARSVAGAGERGRSRGSRLGEWSSAGAARRPTAPGWAAFSSLTTSRHRRWRFSGTGESGLAAPSPADANSMRSSIRCAMALALRSICEKASDDSGSSGLPVAPSFADI